MKLWVLVSLSIISVNAIKAHAYYATSESACTTVDLRHNFPLKMRNQNDLAWCYAHAAADYLQYTYKIDEQISAADIAVNYSKSKWSTFLTFMRDIFRRELRKEPAQTGLIKFAVQMILPQGYCPESSLPSDEWVRIKSDGTSSKVEILQAALDLRSLHAAVKSGKIRSPSQLPWRYDFKNIRSANAFYDLLKSSSKKNLLLKLRSHACTPDRKPFPTSLANNFKIKNKHVFRRFNQHFNHDQAPLTIDFFSDLLRNYDRPTRKIDDLHTVLMIGRRFDSDAGECSYLIKDSYGEQCSRYDPKIKCEGGYVWLPESKLYRALVSSFILYPR